jgi:catechol 2,3-dioxygenase-like lactoylglutathione lyase family enzyme
MPAAYGPGYRGAMSDPVRLTLAATTISSPDPRGLADFYARLLGWPMTEASDGWVELSNPDGGPGLSFHDERAYEPPVWPAQPGRPQMQVHLDIEVDDLERGVAHAVGSGAAVADFQPQDDVRVCLDPDGHPFCLFVRS